MTLLSATKWNLTRLLLRGTASRIWKPYRLPHEGRLALEGPSDVDVEHFETEFTVPDVLLLEETLKFVQVGGSLGAESGSHDDLVMAYAIANQLFSKTRVTEGRQNWGIMVSGKRSALDLDRVLGYQS